MFNHPRRSFDKAIRFGEAVLAALLQPEQRVEELYFLHVGKTGGTAVKDALRDCVDRCARPVLLCDHDVTLRDVPKGAVAAFAIRDPLERFVSGFYSRQRRGRPRYNVPWTPGEAAAFERFATPNDLGEALATGDPTADAAMRAIKHVRDGYARWFKTPEYLLSRADDILFVLRQETLAADLRQLQRLVGAPADLSPPSDDARAHRNPSDLDRRLSTKATAALRDWYAQDYAFLGAFAALRGTV